MYKAYCVDALERPWFLDEADTKQEAIKVADEYLAADKSVVSCYVVRNKEVIYSVNRRNK